MTLDRPLAALPLPELVARYRTASRRFRRVGEQARTGRNRSRTVQARNRYQHTRQQVISEIVARNEVLLALHLQDWHANLHGGNPNEARKHRLAADRITQDREAGAA